MAESLLVVLLLVAVLWIASRAMAPKDVDHDPTHRPDMRAPARPAARETAVEREIELRAQKANQPVAVATVRFTLTTTITPVDDDTTDDGDDADGDDVWAAVAAEPVRCNTDVDLTYRDRDGRTTRRHVTVKEFDYAAPRHMFAFCHLRQARRTFYLSRVTEAVDPETGEVLDSLHEFLRTKYEASPEFSLDRLFAVQRNALRVLLYVGKADGRLMAAERAIIQRVARELAGDDRLTDRQINTVLSEFTAPSKAVFQQAIRSLAKEESLERRLMIMRGAEDIVATQAKVHADEAAALDYMRPRLTAPDATERPPERPPLPGYGQTPDEREREAAALLEARKAEWRQTEERRAAEAAAEALLPPRCGVCFDITGSRLPISVGAPLGTMARCGRCEFTQVLTESGAERPEKFVIAYTYRGTPLPDGVPAPFDLPLGAYGQPRGRIA